MGYCLITGGGADGRYDIELDFGKAQKDAILAALTAAINKNALDVLQTENELAQAQAQEQALGLVLLQLQDTIATGTAAEKAQATIEYPKRAAELAQLKVQNEPLRYKLRQLKFVRASLRKQAQQFTVFQPIQRRQAWCADLTENRAAGSYVGTIEVKGEPDLVLIQPGARAWRSSDGIVLGREVMSPWQAYWNAAVLPGWQKWMPTYRWGTLTAIDREVNTGSVALAAATSSAKRLGVNQDSSLRDVPFQYMTCDHNAFETGDDVIVAFGGQDWANPRIVGFVDNPRGCQLYTLRYHTNYPPNQFGGFTLFNQQQVYRNRDAEPVSAAEPFLGVVFWKWATSINGPVIDADNIFHDREVAASADRYAHYITMLTQTTLSHVVNSRQISTNPPTWEYRAEIQISNSAASLDESWPLYSLDLGGSGTLLYTDWSLSLEAMQEYAWPNMKLRFDDGVAGPLYFDYSFAGSGSTRTLTLLSQSRDFYYS